MLDMFEKGGVGVFDSLRGMLLEAVYPLVPLLPLLWSSHWPLFEEDSDDLLPVESGVVDCLRPFFSGVVDCLRDPLLASILNLRVS